MIKLYYSYTSNFIKVLIRRKKIIVYRKKSHNTILKHAKYSPIELENNKFFIKKD